MSPAAHPSEDELTACPCTGATLDKLIQPAILAVLAEGPMHGYGIAERIGALPAFHGGKPDVSGIYRTLKAMEVNGLLLSSWDLPGSGPARKTYRIAAAGTRCLHRWVEALEEYRATITALLNTARKAIKD